MTIVTKKAVSPMVAYILLIVISVSIAAILFPWLNNRIDLNDVQCPEDVRIVIRNYNCIEPSDQVNITFQNKGLFEVDGVYIRIANQSDGNTIYGLRNASFVNQLTDPQRGFFYFGTGIPNPITPNQEDIQLFDYAEHSQISKIEVQPFILDDESNQLVLCSESAIVDRIVCN